MCLNSASTTIVSQFNITIVPSNVIIIKHDQDPHKCKKKIKRQIKTDIFLLSDDELPG